MRSQFAHTKILELRQSYRYPLRAPVFCCWSTANGSVESCDGMTRDIDTTSAYIYSMELPPVGAPVQLDIMLPNIMGGDLGPHLTGEGVVLRVEPDNGKAPGVSKSGFAVSVQFYVESSDAVLAHLRRSKRMIDHGRND